MPPQNGRKVAAALRQVKRAHNRRKNERQMNGYSCRKYQTNENQTSRNSIGTCVASVS
jgi:Sec-independent protein translocase protein TatA